MEKSIKITLIIVAGVLFLSLIAYSLINSLIYPYSDTLSVQGVSTVNAVPDLVAIYFTIETLEDSSVDAKNSNAEIVANVKSALVEQGIESNQIQTLNFNIYESYDWAYNSRKFLGYQAVHQLKVEIPTEDLEKIGTLIDAGVEAGAEISYIDFELSQELQNEYKAEAMKLAAQDAEIKAESVAEGLNKKVGKLVSVSVNYFGYYPWRTFSATEEQSLDAVKSAATSIQPSEQEISASVTVVFRIR